MRPIVLTNQGDTNRWEKRERKAATKAGFEIIRYNPPIIKELDHGGPNIQGRVVLPRHYANGDRQYRQYVKHKNGRLLVPNYWKANEWYKVLCNDPQAFRWLGRNLSWVDTASLYDEDNPTTKLSIILDDIFRFAVKGKLFIKSPYKLSIGAGLYTKKEAFEAVDYEVAMGVHFRLNEIIYSEPVEIQAIRSGYRKDEYRCVIVGDKVSSVSLYTDYHKERDYSIITKFAGDFAAYFSGKLPSYYVLDVAKLKNGNVVLIELNDICASGWFADNDLEKIFSDLYKLACK